MKQRKSKYLSKKKQLLKRLHFSLIGMFLLFIGMFGVVYVAQQRQDQRSRAAVPGQRIDQTNLTFTANGYTSEYHLYAGGLDWTKPVGLLLYTDGSGEFGLKHVSSSYLLAGSSGMIAVAKKHNMILLTPLSPNKACSDGGGSCWYMGDSSGYTRWAESLVTFIHSFYPIDKACIAVGGYSSGAQFSTEFWVPSGAAQRTMNDGVIVAISFGGSPKVRPVAFTPSFKSNVHMNWNVGDADSSYSSSPYGVKGGYNYYTNSGFQTSLDVVPGVGHGRSGQFGKIMDAQITEHIGLTCPGSASPISEPVPSEIIPTFVCGGSSNCVPSSSPTPRTESNTPTPTLPGEVRNQRSGENRNHVGSESQRRAKQQRKGTKAVTNSNNNNQGFFSMIRSFLELFFRFIESLLAFLFGR